MSRGRREFLVCLTGTIGGCVGTLGPESTTPTRERAAIGTPRERNETQSAWKMQRGTASHRGNPIDGEITADLRKNWTFDSEGVVLTEPVVGGNEVLFVTSRNTIHSVDVRDGSEVWAAEIHTEGQFIRTPVLTDATITVGSRRLLQTRDRDTRREEWARDGFLEKVGAGPTSPILGSGAMYYGLSGQGGVVSVDLDDGTTRWEHTEVTGVNEPPTLSETQAFVVDANGTVVALDRASGERNWDRDLGSASTDSTIGFSNGSLFVGDNDGTLHSYTERGIERWGTDLETDFHVQSPAITDEYVFVTDSKQRLYALNGDSGELVDRLALSSDGSKSLSSPLAQDTKVCVTTSNGEIHVLEVDRERIRQVAKKRTGETFEADPAIVGGRLIVGGSNLVSYSFA